MRQDIQKLYDLFATRLNEIEGRQNFLIQKLGELHNHLTRLYTLERDISDIPPAGGHLLLQQQACLKLAKMLDRDLRAAGIKYFLSAGSLLGAMRTGVFIPWDDDVDFGLFRDDFNNAVRLLSEKYNSGPFRTTWAKSGGIFKVLLLNKVCVDLFPWDFYYKRITTPEEQITFKTDYNTAMDEARKYEQQKSAYRGYTEITADIIMHNNMPDSDTGDIFEGIDWQLFPERIMGYYHNTTWRNEYILPLGEIEFCGNKFMAPNNPDAWLTTRYGDWHTMRPEFSRHISVHFTYPELQFIKKFINEGLR